jgi:spore germination protein KB
MQAPGPPHEQDRELAPYQIALICFVLIGGTAVLTLPEILATYAGQEAWMAALLPLPVGLVPLWLLYDLDRRRPGLSLVEHARASMGRVAGGAVGLILSLSMLVVVPTILREFAGLVAQELPRTPETVVLALLVVVPLLIAREGLGAVARVAGVLTPLAAAALLAIFLPTLDLVRPDRLLPVTAMGWGPLLQASSPTAAFYMETALLGFVLPTRSHGRGPSWVAAGAGLAAVGVVVAAATLWSLLVFGPLTARLSFTLFQITRVAEVAEFITHMDALLVVAWVAGGLVKVAIWLFCLCLSTAQAVGLADYRSLTMPLAALTVVTGQAWFESSAQLTRWIAQIWPFWGPTWELGLPLVIWLAAVVADRRERGRRPRGQQGARGGGGGGGAAAGGGGGR